MSRGLGAVQRRILETLERIEQQSPGAWVRRYELATPKEGQDIERSDISSTARAVNGLVQRGLVEARNHYHWSPQPVVRLLKEDRPPLLGPEADRENRRALGPQIARINDDLRTRGSRIRVAMEDLRDVEFATVVDRETGKSYRVFHLYWIVPHDLT
ncbi:hypothetical protein [Streptomyces sp. SP17KL33]|uniref:hypothetical protein n=1 Tax=Streptomyces sp. SP17KL33 TaxID=3002534 RepID=UPI002E7617FE|nr:hypothetical protein [Streptomyces sp. SP17KL33]MEE1837433.1 hypothetical protein [Streptomyces sp. SP17KL33]